MQATFATIFSDFVIAILAASLTYFFAIVKFKSERWWDLKVIAYQKIIEALHKAKEYSYHYSDVALGVRELSAEKESYLKEGTLLATQEIAKAVDVGTFVISEDAFKRLEQYKKQIDQLPKKTADWYDYLDQSYRLTDDCLRDIKLLAKTDLKKTRL